jgi:methylenetetrahydrofolate reductase (NADPH)
MKVTEHLELATGPVFSYEIVPPPRGRSIKDITDIVTQLLAFKPKWIDVTSHPAGAYYSERPDGSVERKIYKKRPGTIGICGIIQNRFKIDTVVHLLTQGFTKEETEDALIELNYLGVENVLALRGDGLNYNKKIDKSRRMNFYASDLVTQLAEVKKGIFLDDISGAQPMNFCVGVAGYPEKHFEAPNLATDIDFLKMKIDCGADYIVTQMFFDNRHYFNFVDKCRAAGINVPIIPGLKVLKSAKQLQTIPKNFYIDLPDELVGSVLADPDHAKEIGKNWAIKQSEELLSKGAPSLHYYIMNDADTVIDVVKKFH